MTHPDRRTFLGAVAASAALAAAPGGAPADAGKPAPDKPGRTPHTRFAVNVEMWWTKLPFLQRLERAAELGFPAVEFWPYENKDIPAVAKRCKELGLEVAQFTAWGFKPGLNDPKNHEAFVKKIAVSCAVAEQLACRLMTVVGGDDVPGLTQAQMHQNIIDGLKRAAPLAEKHQITLILEPMNIRVDHKGHCLYGSEPAVRICRAVGSKFVKINWDLYHMQISEGDLCGRLREGFDQLGYVQIADHPGRNEPGTGEINYTRVLQELQKLGYKGYVGLELRPKTSELEAARAVWRADQW
jgi:hydroxypyruvate isomerase